MDQAIPIDRGTAVADDADPIIDILRDITRGGLAGLLVGVLLAGIGGRLVMRFAALVVAEATGGRTENGNIIGAITLPGTLALVVAIGLLFGAIAGSLWVVISPWLPSALWPRMAVAVVIAVGLGTRGLIDGANPDFIVLQHDPLVVAALLLLVAAFGPALVLADRWLERRLPRPTAPTGVTYGAYLLVTAIGSLLTLTLVVPAFLQAPIRIAGLALVVVGLATLASWWRRDQRRPAGRMLTLVARGALVVAVVVGFAVAIPNVRLALALY